MNTIPLDAVESVLTFGGWMPVASVERVHGNRFVDGNPMALLRITTEEGHVRYLRFDAVFGVDVGTKDAVVPDGSAPDYHDPLVEVMEGRGHPGESERLVLHNGGGML